mmetsp:Transcript_27934/g.69082  ORF Transcript_27934/g.69082 Transcript_27934/m.69082 type:complete len:219 (-) Transcript_27934:342-998(-)
MNFPRSSIRPVMRPIASRPSTLLSASCALSPYFEAISSRGAILLFFRWSMNSCSSPWLSCMSSSACAPSSAVSNISFHLSNSSSSFFFLSSSARLSSSSFSCFSLRLASSASALSLSLSSSSCFARAARSSASRASLSSRSSRIRSCSSCVFASRSRASPSWCSRSYIFWLMATSSLRLLSTSSHTVSTLAASPAYCCCSSSISASSLSMRLSSSPAS